MIRVTNNYLTNNLMRSLKGHNKEIETLQKQISSQNRISLPHNDPSSSAMVAFYKAKIGEYQRYQNNIGDSISRLNLVDVKLQEVNSYLQLIREQAVGGANGILTKEDREKIGIQIEQYLRQVVQVANSKFKGESMFSGYQTNKEAYNISYGKILDWGEPLLSKVTYKGDIGTQNREIDRGEYMAVNVPGNRTFWAANQRITSQTASTGYMAVSKDSSKPYQNIKIDGVGIRIDDGDNLKTIVDKINNANVPVKASIDNTTGNDFIVLQTTRPHQLWLEDDKGGTVLQDLGLIAQGGSYPPDNYAPNAIVQGNSMFDNIIELRNSLFSNDINGINRGIGQMDEAMDNLRHYIALVGTRQSRLDTANNRISTSVVYANEVYSKIQATDMSKAISDLKNVELSHRAALQVGARIMLPTLLDFIR